MTVSRGLPIFALAFLLAAAVSKAPAQGTSTAEERAQWVEITHKLENSPLDVSIDEQGESALKQVSDAHDIHVPLCPAMLSEFNGMKYTFAHTITRQYMLASTTFLIENPDKTADTKAVNLYADPNQAAKLAQDIQQAQQEGATDIRVNQEQVNAQGQRVGQNRPDLQYTDSNGVRDYIEYDQDPASGAAHAQRIRANDPAGIVEPKTVK
jgi:CheY-like chemotaxis protein